MIRAKKQTEEEGEGGNVGFYICDFYFCETLGIL